jgi:hypothetical protein
LVQARVTARFYISVFIGIDMRNEYGQRKIAYFEKCYRAFCNLRAKHLQISGGWGIKRYPICKLHNQEESLEDGTISVINLGLIFPYTDLVYVDTEY